MRSIVILLLLVCLAGVHAAPVSHSSSTATNSTESPVKPSVYVTGQVQKPGRYDWFSGMTVVDAITAAGGLKDSAGHLIWITRIEGSRMVRIIFHGDTFPYGIRKPPLLKEGDTVQVLKKLERPNVAPTPIAP